VPLDLEVEADPMASLLGVEVDEKLSVPPSVLDDAVVIVCGLKPCREGNCPDKTLSVAVREAEDPFDMPSTIALSLELEDVDLVVRKFDAVTPLPVFVELCAVPFLMIFDVGDVSLAEIGSERLMYRPKDLISVTPLSLLRTLSSRGTIEVSMPLGTSP
jgi:hypothetical protein